MLNFIDQDCVADVYWGNTSGNVVIGDLVKSSDESTAEEVYGLLEPGGVVWAPLDLGMCSLRWGLRASCGAYYIFLGILRRTKPPCLTTRCLCALCGFRTLRLPGCTVPRSLSVSSGVAGGRTRLMLLHEALWREMPRWWVTSLRALPKARQVCFDLTSENSWHMLLLGLLFNMRGYADPISNREYGLGRPDIRVEPVESPFAQGKRPLITIELKYERDVDSSALECLAADALQQISDRRYDEGPLPEQASSRVRWGIACSGKRVAAVCECKK